MFRRFTPDEMLRMISFVSICLILVYRSTEELFSHIETSTQRSYVKDIHKNNAVRKCTLFYIIIKYVNPKRVQTGIGLIRGNL